jgi:drug/metabolite transporter (DMT)-like permease
MVLSPLVFLLVLFAAFGHASWNAMVKAGRDPLVTQTYVICIPGFLCGLGLFFVPLPDAASWPFIIASALIHQLYYFVLLTAYRHGDLSQVYPIARGAAPALVALTAWIIADEALTALQGVGLAVVCLGIVSFSRALPLPGRRIIWRDGEVRAILFALLTAATIASYTVIDGLGVRASGTALGYIFWLFFFEAVPLAAVAVWARRGRLRAAFGAQVRRGIAGGLIAGLAYGIVIWAMGVAPLAHVVALRETSVIIAAVIGTRLLAEPFGTSRLAAAIMVVAGTALLHLKG